MIALALLLLAQAPANDAKLRILVLDVKSESVGAETTRALRDGITVELSREPTFDVLSTEDLRAALTIEAEKSAMGCDTSSCLAEIGAAMGARFVVHANVATVGATRIAYVNLFDTEQNTAVAREAADATDDAQLLAAVRTSAARIRERIGGAPASAAASTSAPGIDGLLFGGAVLAIVGAGVAVAGGFVMAGARETVVDLDRGVKERQDAQGVGIAASIATVVGVAALAGGAVLATWSVVE